MRQACCAGGLWRLQFCRFWESFRGVGSTRQPQRKEPCQCVSGQPWACHGALQGQMHPLMCAAGLVGPVLRAVAAPGRWFVGGCGFAILWRLSEEKAAGLANHSAQSPASVWVASPGQHAVVHCKAKCRLCCVQQMWWGLHWGLRQGCCLCRWLVGVAVLPV